MLTEDQIEAMARANWPGIEWDDESLAESAHLCEAFRAGVRAVIAAHEAKAAPAVPQGWHIAITGCDEVVVRAPSNGPGAMTIPSGSDGALPVRLLDALCRALLSSPSQEPPDVWPFITPHEVALRLGPQEVVLRFVTESETQRAGDAIIAALREKEGK